VTAEERAEIGSWVESRLKAMGREYPHDSARAHAARRIQHAVDLNAPGTLECEDDLRALASALGPHIASRGVSPEVAVLYTRTLEALGRSLFD
jgi:hypothetical protein